MRKRVRYMVLFLWTCLVPPAAAGSPPPAAPAAPEGTSYEKVHATRVAGPAIEHANPTQFLAADSEGHLRLLRGDTLEVFRLGAEDSFDRRVGKLVCTRAPDAGSAYLAAMDPAGWSWAVGSPDEVAICDFAKEQHPQGLDWMISSLTYAHSGPLVAVTSLGPPPEATDNLRLTEPRVFGLVDGRWRPLVSTPVPTFKSNARADVDAAIAELRAHPMEALAKGKAESESLICTRSTSEIWLASQNSYRLLKVAASEKPEKPEREVVVGSGEVEWPKLAKEDQEREARERKAQGVGAPSTVRGASPRAVVRALLCGREIYLVVATADGLAVDRFDPSQNVLERVLLDGVRVSSSGPMTAVLAGNELWLGGRFAADGLWRISLEDLASSHWKPVQDVKIDGKPSS